MPEDNQYLNEQIDDLKRQLALKRLQINRLLDITQAINNNVKAKELFEMYRAFLNWELTVNKLALFIKEEQTWECVVFMGIEEELVKINVEKTFSGYNRVSNLNKGNLPPILDEFEVIIPVLHKDIPIAYALIGGFKKDKETSNQVQMATTMTNIIAVAIENKRLFNQQFEQGKLQERSKQEMLLAIEMQQSLVPKDFPVSAHFDVSHIYLPHSGVGGDYYDVVKFRQDRYLFCVADISGKGTAAAILMANFQANLHAIIRSVQSPEDFIEQLNRAVLRITRGDKFITFFVAELDINTRRMRYINAGHIPPVLMCNGEVQLLTTGTPILGFFKNLPKIEVGELFITDETYLILFTDGITDIKNKDGQYFDVNHLINFVKNNCCRNVASFNKILMEEIDTFREDEAYPDDITVLTCHFASKKS
jgi:phosphoserine phosphatase RsbU/P